MMLGGENTKNELDTAKDTTMSKHKMTNILENEKWVFHPTNPLRLKWDLVISVIMVYIVINVPIQICFEADLSPNHPWSWADFTLNILFIVDLLINFNTGFFHQERLILSRREIAKQYLQFWFWLDLITSIPFDRFVTGNGASKISSISKILKIFRVARLLKLLRMLRLLNQMTKWEDRDDSSATRVRLLKFVLVIFLAGHLAACGWVGVANYYRTGDRHDYSDYFGYNEMSWIVRFQNTFEKSVLELYLRALYWAFTTLSTVGYGDITPVLPLEVAFAICTQLGGSTMFGFIIGNVASIVTHEDEDLMIIKDKISAVSSYMEFRELPPPLIRRIRSHYEYSWKRSKAIKEEEIMSDLPSSLRLECSLFIHRDIITNTPFLSMLGDDVVPNLVNRLKPVLAGPTDIVVKESFHGNEMFFISNGSLQLSFKNSLHLFDKHTIPEIFVDDLTHNKFSKKLGKRFLQNTVQSRRYSTSVNSDARSHRLSSDMPPVRTLRDSLYDEAILESTHSPSGLENFPENSDPEIASPSKPSTLHKLFVFFTMRFFVREQSNENKEDKTEAFICGEEEVWKITSPILLKVLMWKNRAQFQVSLRHMNSVEKRHREKYQLDHEATSKGAKTLNGTEGEDLGLSTPRDRLQNDVDSIKIQLFQVQRTLALIAQELGVDDGSFIEKTKRIRKTTSMGNLHNKDFSQFKCNPTLNSADKPRIKKSTNMSTTLSVKDQCNEEHVVGASSPGHGLFFKMF